MLETLRHIVVLHVQHVLDGAQGGLRCLLYLYTTRHTESVSLHYKWGQICDILKYHAPYVFLIKEFQVFSSCLIKLFVF